MIEKLTFEGNFCDLALCQEPVCPYPDTGCSQRKVLERLKEYEDIFGGEDIDVLGKLWEAHKDGRCVILECDNFKQHKKPISSHALNHMKKSEIVEYIRDLEHNLDIAISVAEQQYKNCMSLSYPYDRLAEANELLELKDAGRCVILPCKVGDIVYIINRDSKNSIGKYEVTTSEIDIHKYKITDIVKRDYEFWADEVGGGYIVTFSKESFGKTVFFTREEAEAALKEQE